MIWIIQIKLHDVKNGWLRSVEDHSWGLPTYQPYPCNIQFICQRTTYLLTNHIYLVSNSYARIHTQRVVLYGLISVLFQRGTWIIGVMEFFWLSWEKKCERGGRSCCAPPLFEEPKPLPTDIKILLGSWDDLYKAQLGIRVCSSIVIVYIHTIMRL